MSFEKIVSQEKEKIIAELYDKGYSNTTVNYEGFLSIYEPYKELMGELEFAYLLGLSYEKFRSLRTKRTKTIILIQNVSNEMQEEIRMNLLNRGYCNKMINYEEFLELYKPFSKSITEKEFSKIIRMSYSTYRNIKNRGGKTTILRTDIDPEKIKTEINKEYGSITITYGQFLNMYEKYKTQINNEGKFAEILGISVSNFNSMKNNGTRARILKKIEVSEELGQEIKNFILQKGYNHKLITYAEFLTLYKQYDNKISEQEFAKVIGITSTKYRNMRYYNNKTYVYGKSKKMVPDKKREKEIYNELINRGYANKTIHYQDFLEIYNEFKDEIEEIAFAELIGISYGNFMTFKNARYGAIILKTQNLTNDIIQAISKDENIKKVAGKLINNTDFENLYKQYSNFMTRIQFAELIGITPMNYGNIKKNRVKVERLYAQKLRIKHIIRESRVYSLKEIEDFCKSYDCDIMDFLKIVCKNESEGIASEYMEILRKKGIFIGQTPINEDVFYKYGNEIVNFINKQSQFMGVSYRQNSYCDDVASDTILYITQKRGDLFINFNEGKALRILKCIAKKYIKYSYLSYMRVRKISLDEKDEMLGKDHHKYTVDKKKDVEKMVLEKIDEEAKSKYLQCVNLLQQYYEKGLSSTETIERVCQELKISKKEVLAILKQRLLEKQQSERLSFEDYCL